MVFLSTESRIRHTIKAVFKTMGDVPFAVRRDAFEAPSRRNRNALVSLFERRGKKRLEAISIALTAYRDSIRLFDSLMTFIGTQTPHLNAVLSLLRMISVSPKPDISFLAVPIRDHAFFEQLQFQGLLGDDFLQRLGLSQVLDLAARAVPPGFDVPGSIVPPCGAIVATGEPRCFFRI
jgi:hypothetical protein